MALGVTLLADGNSTLNRTSYTQAQLASLSRAPAAGTHVVAHLAYEISSGTPPAPTVTIAGVTLTLIDDWPYKDGGTSNVAIAVYAGFSNAWSGTDLTVDFGATGMIGCAIDVMEVTGADPSWNFANLVEGGGSSLANNATLSATVPNAEQSADSRAFAVFGQNRSTGGYTPRANWTELSEDFHSNPSSTLVSLWRSDA